MVRLELVELVDEMLSVSEKGDVMLSVSSNGLAMIVDGGPVALADSLGVILSVSEKREIGGLIDAMLSLSSNGEVIDG